ncbi:MAG: hypothetical protein IPJ47_22850 [Anaerolineales bacterium]|nr:hypothetical protein [Anaerolineales bacterium]
MNIVAVLAFVHLASFFRVHWTNVFLAFVHVGTLNVRTEDGCASSKVVNIAEADLGIGGIEVLTIESLVQSRRGGAALMALDTKVGVVSDEVAIGIFTAKTDGGAAGECQKRQRSVPARLHCDKWCTKPLADLYGQVGAVFKELR